MLTIDTLFNMVIGSIQNALTNPFTLEALKAYLVTTFLAFVIMPGILGLFAGKDWFAPAFKFWGAWFVGGPLNAVRVVIHAIAQAIADLTCRRFTAEKPLGHIIAFGANFAFWVTNLFAKIVVAVTSLGQKAKSTTPAHH